MDLNYDHLEDVTSNEVRGLDSYIKVIKWWLTNHEPSDDFWIRNPIGNVSDRALSELKTLVPSLGELRRDFQTFIKIYRVLETINERWDQVRVGEINSLIEQWHAPLGVRTLKTFWSDADPNITNIQFMARYAQCAKTCLEHILEKTRLGKDLGEKFDVCRNTTDLLNQHTDGEPPQI